MPDPVTPDATVGLPALAGLAVAAGAAAAAAALVTVAATDLGARRIANRAVVVVAVGAMPMLAALGLASGSAHAAIASLLFLAGLAAFRAGLVGGGDVKLMAAVGLWAGPGGLALLLLVQAAVTLLLVPVLLIGGQAVSGSAAGASPAHARPTMPLGVAIAAGGLAVILSRLGYLGA